jgi:hypothetical protein
LVVVAATVIGLVLKVSVGALSVPATVMTSRALGFSPVFAEPQPARKTRGSTAVENNS